MIKFAENVCRQMMAIQKFFILRMQPQRFLHLRMNRK